eukprot:scaffold17134_cov53-Phaeocystis_antarctica.AAC.1
MLGAHPTGSPDECRPLSTTYGTLKRPTLKRQARWHSYGTARVRARARVRVRVRVTLGFGLGLGSPHRCQHPSRRALRATPVVPVPSDQSR